MIRQFILAIAIFLLSIPALAQVVEPIRYWNLNGPDYLRDGRSKEPLNVENYKCKYEIVDRGSGKAIDLRYANCPVITSAIRGNVKSQVTVEFLAKGKSFEFTSFPSQEFHIYFTYPLLQFTTTVMVNGNPERDNWIMELTGAGRKSFNYYTDGNWHHWVFLLDAGKGMKQVYVDGQVPDGFTKTFKPGSAIYAEGADGFTNSGMLDEIAFYNVVLPPGLVRQHYDEISAGGGYSFTVKEGGPVVHAAGNEASAPDKLEFAPGYPVYTVQATDQLKVFPLPRFARNNPTRPNFPWTDITYLHRELPAPGAKGFGTVSAAKAVELTEEMARNWHYSMELPCLRTDSADAVSAYRDPGSVPGALLRFANSHPQYTTATIIMEAQINPSHAGLPRQDCYMNAQDLGDSYYLRDGQGKPVIYNGKKWLSPLMSLDIIQKDGWVSAFYLKQMLKYLHRPLDYINENGELFGHMRPRELLEKDPAVKRQMAGFGMNNAQYNGWFQNRIDECYKNEVLSRSGARGVFFTIYNVSAYNAEYWPDYVMRRNTNTRVGSNHYSTPSFYPCYPSNWMDNRGAWNGYGAVAWGRKKEIGLGDRLFAPFVAAGWGLEESNIRPAQWLALLKSMMMLGADFFHVGYFNVTGAGGWPDGKGPNDPRGYIYQIAMPAYTQAIASRCFDFLKTGILLNPADTADKVRQFRFKGNNENELILVRKLGQRFLIYGSLQPMSNIKGNIPDKVSTEIQLDNEAIRFEIRRQGSVYLLDKTNPQAPVFFQLDGWQEATHPWYWTKQFLLEAEMPDNYAYPEIAVGTETVVGRKSDFTGFVSFIQLKNAAKKLEYDFNPRERKNFYCYIRARANSSNSSVAGSIKQGAVSSNCSINGREWKWYPFKWPSGDAIDLAAGLQTLVIHLQTGAVDIDKIVISPYRISE